MLAFKIFLAPELFLISIKTFLDDDAYALYDKKKKSNVLNTSLSSMDEQKLIRFMYDIAKIRAPPPKQWA